MAISGPSFLVTAARLGLGLILSLVALIYVVHVLDPFMPQPGLDASWMVVTGEASSKPLRWGIDLAFTYGPTAPLATAYYNSEYFSHTAPLMLLLSLSFGFGSACLLVQPLRERANIGTLCLALAMILSLLVCGQIGIDFFFFSLSLLVFLLAMARRDGLVAVALYAGGLALGTTALTKTSYLVLSLPLLALADIRHYKSGLRPLLVASFISSLLLTYLFYHQQLSDLPIYVAREWSVASGYSEAMSTYGKGNALYIFLVLAAGLIAAGCADRMQTGSKMRRPDDRWFIVPGFVLYLLVLVKAGFVRFDGGHFTIAFGSFAIGGLLYAAWLIPRRRRIGIALAVTAFLTAMIAVPMANGQSFNLKAVVATYKQEVRGELRARSRLVRTALQDLAGYAPSLDLAKADAWKSINAERNLPKLPGTVDVIQSEQSSLIASGMDYHPRPSFQEYSTYTAELIAANKAFFESDSAPDWIIFAPGSIDNRYPASAEGASWPDFLRFYAPERWVKEALALHRRRQPLPELLGPAVTHALTFGQALPIEAGRITYASLHVRRNWLGALANILFRPPLLTMAIRLSSGEEKTFRYLPAQGDAGFILSPFLTSPIDFAKIAFGRPETLKGHDVVQVAITAPPSSRIFYAPDIQITLQDIDAAVLAQASAPESLTAVLDPHPSWTDMQASAMVPLKDDRLYAQAPSALTFPVLGRKRLRFGYGILNEAWSDEKTEGLCFAVEQRPALSAPLWRKCLDPVNHEDERGEFSAEVAVPADADAVVLSTQCRSPCTAPYAYWSRFGVE